MRVYSSIDVRIIKGSREGEYHFLIESLFEIINVFTLPFELLLLQ